MELSPGMVVFVESGERHSVHAALTDDGLELFYFGALTDVGQNEKE